MLLKSKITNIEMLSDAWKQNRLTLFTSSKWHLLMGEKGLGIQGMSYIRSKVAEALTGMSSEQEFETEWTIHGNMYENEGIQKVMALKGWEFVIIQKLIHEKGSKTSSTPDFIVPTAESEDKTAYAVETGEIKCFQGDSHIKCAVCSTPEELKEVNKQVYWQVIHQMKECDSLKGYAVFYNPYFKQGGLRIIEFRKVNLINDFKLLVERERLALSIFESTLNKMKSIKN